MSERAQGIREGLDVAIKLIQEQQDAVAKNRITTGDFDRGMEAAFGMALYVVMTAAKTARQ